MSVHNWGKSGEVTKTPEKEQDILENILCLFWCSGDFPRFTPVTSIQLQGAVWGDVVCQAACTPTPSITDWLFCGREEENGCSLGAEVMV